MPQAQGGAFGDGDDGEAPWHDQTLPIAERMKLADGRPLRRRMMAAMAQQDCGQCGYNCNDYSDKLFAKDEERLNLCVPGGKETAPHAEIALRGARQGACAPQRRRPSRSRAAPQPVSDAGRSRDNPATATFVGRTRLNKRGLREGDLASRFRSQRRRSSTTSWAMPSACSRPTIRRWPMPSSRRSACSPDFPIGGRSLRDVLIDGCRAVARTRLAVPADLLHHRRRAAAEGQGARIRAKTPTATRRPSTCSRRWRNLRACGPTRKPSSRRSSRCSRGSTRSRRRPRPSPAGSRSRSTRCATTSTAATRLGVASTYPRRSHRARRTASRSMCRRRTPSACRPIRPCRSSWSAPAPASRRSAPSCTSAWRPRRRAATGCSSATSGATTTSSTRTSSTA